MWKDYLLFIWNSSSAGHAIFLFVKSGNPTKGASSNMYPFPTWIVSAIEKESKAMKLEVKISHLLLLKLGSRTRLYESQMNLLSEPPN